MNAQCRQFSERLVPRLEALSQMIEICVLDQMIEGGDTFCSCHFEFEESVCAKLCEVFQGNPRLWGDFKRAVASYRAQTHLTILLEHVFKVGKLEGALRLLELGRSCPFPDERRRLAEHLNRLDGEIANCRGFADRRDLAERVNGAVGFPLLDGLTMRGLTYVLGGHPELWRLFRALVETSAASDGGSASLSNVKP